MKKNLSIAILLATFSTSVVAADSGFYAGGGVGQANTKLDNGTLSKKSDTAFSLLGGYRLSQNMAVEAQYANLGKVSSAAGNADIAAIAAIAATAVVAVPLNTEFSFYGKLGFARTSYKGAANGVSVNRTTATFGLGGLFKLDPNLGVRMGWDRYAIGDASTVSEGNVDLISVGVVYKF